MSQDKVCRDCGEEKHITEFPSKSRKDGVYYYPNCKSCRNKQIQKHYLDNSSSYKKRAYHWNKKQLEKHQNLIFNYLSKHPCVDCGETDPVVLEFDHVRGKKKYTISKMAGRYSNDSVLNELKKCDVRCANCHRRKTAKDFGYSKLLLSQT